MSKTADPFLEMLTSTAARAPKPKKQGPFLGVPGLKPEPPKSLGKYWSESASQSGIDDYASGNVQVVKVPFQPDYSTELDEMELPKPHARPDFADDIDRIVAQLVADGLVVFDQATDSYRRPNVRRWRFAK